MNRPSSLAICTDVTWLGRAHCGKCGIRHLMLFSELPETAFDHLLQPVDHYTYSPGSTLYEAESQKKFIYSIRRGLVKLVNVSEDGTHRIVRLLGPGSAIGLELLDGANGYHHTAIAVNQVDLCKLPVATVKDLEIKYPQLCGHIREQLQSQLNLADQWIVALSTGSAKQRAAQLILVMEKHFSDDKGAFVLLSREDMAAMTGIAAETISRTIAAFKRQDILSKNKGKGGLYLCNTEKLEAVIQQE